MPPMPQVPNFTVLFVPRKTLVCEELLKHLGVYGDLTFGEVAIDIIPYERDVLSIEYEAGDGPAHSDSLLHPFIRSSTYY